MLAAYNPYITGQYNPLLYRTTKQDFDHGQHLTLAMQGVPLPLKR